MTGKVPTEEEMKSFEEKPLVKMEFGGQVCELFFYNKLRAMGRVYTLRELKPRLFSVKVRPDGKFKTGPVTYDPKLMKGSFK